jgi:hypothetical protein
MTPWSQDRLGGPKAVFLIQPSENEDKKAPNGWPDPNLPLNLENGLIGFKDDSRFIGRLRLGQDKVSLSAQHNHV